MKCCTPKGFKSYKEGKCVAEEVLPSRMAKATITGGDLMQRMMGNYGKNQPKTPENPMMAMMRRFM